MPKYILSFDRSAFNNVQIEVEAETSDAAEEIATAIGDALDSSSDLEKLGARIVLDQTLPDDESPFELLDCWEA